MTQSQGVVRTCSIVHYVHRGALPPLLSCSLPGTILDGWYDRISHLFSRQNYTHVFGIIFFT